MPKEMERVLKKEVRGKNWSKERKNAYVYGTMRKTGWTPSTQKPKMGHTPLHTNPMENMGEPNNSKFLR